MSNKSAEVSQTLKGVLIEKFEFLAPYHPVHIKISTIRNELRYVPFVSNGVYCDFII